MNGNNDWMVIVEWMDGWIDGRRAGLGCVGISYLAELRSNRFLTTYPPIDRES